MTPDPITELPSVALTLASSYDFSNVFAVLLDTWVVDARNACAWVRVYVSEHSGATW